MRRFLPSDLCRPTHLPPLAQTGEVSVVVGPDGGPGRIVGGTYQRGEPGWVQVGGWWINAEGSSPAQLLRLDARDGDEIDGADGHRWLIPHLFRPAAGGLLWAGEQRRGPDGWAVPPPPEPWRSVGLRLLPHLVAGDWESLGDNGCADLAMALICTNYHLVPAELLAARWTTRAMIAAAFTACLTLEG